MAPPPHSPPPPSGASARQHHVPPMTTIFVHAGRGMTEETALDESPANPHAPVPPPELRAPRILPTIPFSRALGRDVLDPVCCALSSTGGSLHVAARMHSIWLHAIDTADEARTRSAGDIALSARSCALAADGDTVAFAGVFGLEIIQRGGQTLLTVDRDELPIAPFAPYSVALSADAAVVALSMLRTTTVGGRIVVFQTADCKPMALWDVYLNLNQGTVALSAAGDVVAHAFVGGAQVVDARTGRVRKRWVANGSLDVALDSVGELVAIADERRLRVRDMRNSAGDVDVLGFVPPNFDPQVAISGDGGIVVAAVREHRFAIFCAKTGAMRAILTGQSAPATGLAVSENAGVVLACAIENQVHLWRISDDVKNGKLDLRVVRGQSRDIEHELQRREENGPRADSNAGEMNEIEKVE